MIQQQAYLNCVKITWNGNKREQYNDIYCISRPHKIISFFNHKIMRKIIFFFASLLLISFLILLEYGSTCFVVRHHWKSSSYVHSGWVLEVHWTKRALFALLLVQTKNSCAQDKKKSLVIEWMWQFINWFGKNFKI